MKRTCKTPKLVFKSDVCTLIKKNYKCRPNGVQFLKSIYDKRMRVNHHSLGSETVMTSSITTPLTSNVPDMCDRLGT